MISSVTTEYLFLQPYTRIKFSYGLAEDIFTSNMCQEHFLIGFLLIYLRPKIRFKY